MLFIAHGHHHNNCGASRYLPVTVAQWSIFFLLVGWDFGTAATTGLLYQPQMIGDSDCDEICGMNIGRASRSTLRKPAPAPLCPPQIPLV
jgi:hypothetical protein